MTHRLPLPALLAALTLNTAALGAPIHFSTGSPSDNVHRSTVSRVDGSGGDDAAMELTLQVPLKEVVLDSEVYCPDQPHALWCAGDGGKDGKLTLAQVQSADVKLRAVYAAEMIPQKEEAGAYWGEATTGDCKTYALTLAGRLAAAGEGGQYMYLMMSLPDPFEAHMTLLVDTSDEGLVEIGDEDGGEPHRFDIDQWVRIGFSPFDGRKLWYMTVSQEEVALKFALNPLTELSVSPPPKTIVPPAKK